MWRKRSIGYRRDRRAGRRCGRAERAARAGVGSVLESGDIINVANLPSLAGSRTVLAVFAETSAPLFPSFEADVAIRYDHYSDFGSTTNPKLSLRWQPHRTLLLRASAGTGFFAPSLSGLHQPLIFGFTNSTSDPARCPITQSAQDCNRQFPTLFGGNPRVSNEFESVEYRRIPPMAGLSLGIDYVSSCRRTARCLLGPGYLLAVP